MFLKLLVSVMLLAAAIKSGKLVSERQWKRYVGGLKKEADKLGFFRSKAAARKEISSALVAAIKKRAAADKNTGRANSQVGSSRNSANGDLRFGVLLSGGVDSSFIALILKKLGCRFPCFSVGISGSKDLAAAKYAAKKLKLRLIFREYAIAATGK